MKLTDHKKVYFGCTGNTCRSPMAQKITLVHLADRGTTNIDVQSRRSQIETPSKFRDFEDTGEDFFFFDQSAPKKKKRDMSDGTAKVIEVMYNDQEFINDHKSRSFTPQELKEAGLVMVMSHSHKNNLLEHVEAWTSDKRSKVYTLPELAGQPGVEVSDPMGAGYTEDGRKDPELEEKAYFDTFKQLNQLIGVVVKSPSLPEQTFQDRFFGTMQYILQETINPKPKGALKRAGKWIAKKAEKKVLTPYELWEDGDYEEAIEARNNDVRESVKTYAEMVRAVSGLNKLNKTTDAQKLRDLLHGTVLPQIISGGFTDDEWYVDNRKIIADIAEPTLEIMRTVPEIVTVGSLEAAFAAQRFTKSALNVATKGKYSDFKADIARYAIGRG